MEELAPSSVNVLPVGRPAKSTGLNQRVYQQMRRDFMVAGPFVLHSDVPELLAASWCLIRETLFVGEVDRGSKETVAWAVSKSNQCSFCVDAHFAAVRATNNKNERLAAWAEATAKAQNPLLSSAPFKSSPGEYIGTVVAFHYLNRMVSVFLDEKMMPVPDIFDGVAGGMAKVMMGGMVQKIDHLNTGESLPLLPKADASLAWKPHWAASSAHVADALAGWSSTVESVMRVHFNKYFINAIGNQIDKWTGGDAPDDEHLYAVIRDVFKGADLLCAEIALCVVYAPYKVSVEQLEAALEAKGSSQSILALVAWASQRAARRCGDWTAFAARM